MRESIRRRETQVALSDRGERYRRIWLPPEPRRALILVHGYAEHAGRYDEMAMYFAERGFAVHAFDQVGHGRTSGPRGHVDRFSRLSEEVARFVDLVELDHPGLPMTLLGHSMGGLVVAESLLTHHPAVDRVVLSGALLALEADFRQRMSLALARLLSAIVPGLGLATGLDPSGLSRDPEVVRRYVDDPYVEDRMSARFAAGMNRALASVSASASAIEVPMMILHGGQDPIAPARGSQAFHAGLRSDVAERSRLEIYPELRHEIFNEPEREAIWQDILDWLAPTEGGTA